MKTLTTLIAFLISYSCYSQREFIPLSSWTSYSLPLHPDSIHKYSFDLLGEWTVCIKNNEILASKTRQKTSDTLPFQINPNESERYKIGGSRSVIEVNDGYLVGFYRGEWGGNLYWFSKDGKLKYEISNDEIVQFVKWNNKIYAIQGLSHLISTSGSIIEIKLIDKKWITIETLKLPAAPYGFDIDSKNNLIVITSKSLLKVDANFKTTVLVNEHFWYPGFYPTSLIVKDDIVYVGMRKGVYKYNLETHKQEWLMKD